MKPVPSTHGGGTFDPRSPGLLLSKNTSMLLNNTSIRIFIPMLGIKITTGRFFIPPVVFINSGIVLPNSIVVFDQKRIIQNRPADSNSCKWFTICFINYPIPHQFHISEVPADILN